MADLIASRPLVIYQGDDEPITWELASRASGAPVDLSGYSAIAQVREVPDFDSPVLHEWSTTAGNAELSTQDSTVSLKVTDSEDWTWRRGYFDLHVIDFAGRSKIVDRGPVVVVPGVTRPV
jgi:hypothetical protein